MTSLLPAFTAGAADEQVGIADASGRTEEDWEACFVSMLRTGGGGALYAWRDARLGELTSVTLILLVALITYVWRGRDGR